jgi:dephospho-CoA kinase
MLKIGLTGNIGSGKSLVCKLFAQFGVPIFNADLEAKKILDKQNLRPKLLATFGNHIEDKKHNIIDRKKLAAIVFQDKKALNKLNSLIHPELRIAFQYWSNLQSKSLYVIEEAAILFENDFADLFDRIIVVVAPKNLRLKRVMQRDGASKEEVLARMKNQWSDEKKEAEADFIIWNDEEHLLIPQVLDLHQKFLSWDHKPAK